MLTDQFPRDFVSLACEDESAFAASAVGVIAPSIQANAGLPGDVAPAQGRIAVALVLQVTLTAETAQRARLSLCFSPAKAVFVVALPCSAAGAGLRLVVDIAAVLVFGLAIVGNAAGFQSAAFGPAEPGLEVGIRVELVQHVDQLFNGVGDRLPISKWDKQGFWSCGAKVMTTSVARGGCGRKSGR